ncbi:hypothetical protein DID73_01450 [Candidatus Marinamargulisbacteria bacterium SCGC AG-343-K17]|nr:hypothetical protein DID73_01450 [Candidatus Marinamargulisbacteria bacterium SCGC AG-343-K17]
MLNNKPCILIADDEPNICRIAKLIISPDEFDVITAENGLDAYEKAIKFQPALVFSDILMPKCDGFELCHKIKSNDRTQHIPFIFLTGLDEKQFKSRLNEVNADDYLTKPFSSQDMKNMINRWVEKPIIHSEDAVVPIEKQANNKPNTFQFGNETLDDQLFGEIYPQTFTLINGPIGSGKSSLTRQFIMDGIQKEQLSMLLSFETPKEKLDPIFSLNDSQKKYLQFCDASRWTTIDSEPWRNIDYIFDYISSECASRSFQRIVIDSFSHGFAFWPLVDILKFIDLCRALPNYQNQCMLWTINSHPQIESIEYHLQHVMDIGIRMKQTDGEFLTEIEYSKWQSYSKDAPTTTPSLDSAIA